MEHNPSLTPAYLAGKVDEYVKFAARDTIKRNARRDRNARWARVPDGEACDFCKMLGSRGFVYHSEAKAETRESDGDKYHPFCNCQIAVCFDPFIEEYHKGWTKVTRGYGDGELAVPGRDGSNELREVDIDELFAEYQAMLKDFNKGRKGSRYRDYTCGAMLADEQFDAAMKRLADARTREELHEAADDIVAKWPANANGRNKRQWGELSRLAKAREKELMNSEAVQPLRMSGREAFSHYASDDARARDWVGFGRLSPLRDYGAGIENKARANLQSKDDLVFLKPAADLAVERGYVTYTKPFSAFEAVDDERRDIFAHMALASGGHDIEVIPEARGQKNIDLKIGGKYWEVKSPDADGLSSKDPTKFVQNNIEAAYDQFKGHPKTTKADTRIVFNCRYTPVSDELIAERIEREMAKRPDIQEVLMVTKRGELIHFPR